MLIKDKEAASELIQDLSSIAHLSFFAETVPARHLGSTAALFGRMDEARAYYYQALDACAKIGFRPEIALTRLQLAELLLEHYPNERAEALDHLDFAIQEFRDMKMQPSLERALRHRWLLRA